VNRTELIDAVSGDTGLTRQQSEAAIDAIVYEITSGVRSGNPVRITGFGTFKLRERQARRGRNPQTGAPVRIKASKGIGFTPGVKLKADLNSRGAIAKPKGMAAPAAAPAKRSARAASAPAKATSRASAAKKAPAKTTARAAAKKANGRVTASKRAVKR
jgi:DNA-binding protein HU-beta